MVLVLVSRKVKGAPVGVEPTFNTCCAEALTGKPSAIATVTSRTKRLNFIVPPRKLRAPHAHHPRKAAVRNYGHIDACCASGFGGQKRAIPQAYIEVGRSALPFEGTRATSR